MRFPYNRMIYRKFRSETLRNDRRYKRPNHKKVNKGSKDKSDQLKANSSPGIVATVLGWSITLLFSPVIIFYSILITLWKNSNKNLSTETAPHSNKNRSFGLSLLQIDVFSSNTNNFLNKYGVPEPTRSLLWITNSDPRYIRNSFQYDVSIGKKPIQNNEDIYNLYAEPSLIWTRLPVKKSNSHLIEPIYFPSYSVSLTPEQRWEYLCWLKDIKQKAHLSYVFIYYYGLERHLVLGDYDKAVDEIIKLREFHTHPSFNDYSISALISASAHRKRVDIIQKYPQLLEETTTEAIYLRYLAGKDVTASYIYKLFLEKKVFSHAYLVRLVEKNPDKFKQTLSDVFDEYIYAQGSILGSIHPTSLNTTSCLNFANTSFPPEMRSSKTPDLINNSLLQQHIKKIISATYYRCK
jgi:hypothetical protein